MLPARHEPTGAPGEVIQFTSGTSGFPSGCLFDLDALLRNAGRHADAIGQQPDDTVLVTLPLHFSYALVAQTLATLLRGGRLIITGPPFTITSYMKTVAEHHVAVSSLTPVGARAILGESTALSPSLRVLTVGGDALPAEQVAQLLARRPGQELYLTYGLTQCGPRVSTLSAHQEPPERLGSVGLPLPGTRTRLQTVGNGSGMTQLLVACDTVMKRRAGQLDEGSRSDWASPGEIATGDLFDQDGDGYLYFRGRLSDFIIRNGEKISLTTVRRIAVQLPHVVRAKTTGFVRPDGDGDYDLTLSVDGAGALDVKDYQAGLRKRLLRREWPHELRVLRLDEHVPGYK
jgi:acyl-CoA synthetase (AMP-forming)/AMP-acid ligase II